MSTPRLFPPAPPASGARRTVRCISCKEVCPIHDGETFAQRQNPKVLGDRRACACGRLQITGRPGWREDEELRRRLGT